jgi:hypothetical protein
MKHLLILCYLACSPVLYAQQFGATISADQAIPATTVGSDISATENLKLKGTILEACQVKGCWMTMDLGNNQSMRVTFKDYGFFVPTDCSGKTAVVQGNLNRETIDIATLKHLAEDAGRSKQEIASITEPETELVFVADGVLLMP